MSLPKHHRLQGIPSSGGVIYIDGGLMTHCFQGINLSWFDNSTPFAALPTYVNAIEMSGNLMLYPFNQGAAAGRRGEIGIYGTKYTGLAIANNNFFRSLKYGVQGLHINKWGIIANTFDGCGTAVSASSSAFAFGSCHVQNNDIDDCSVGIQSLGGVLTTKGNNINGTGMLNGSIGIAAVQTHFNIYNDQISNQMIGLVLQNNSISPNIAHENVLDDNLIGTWLLGNNGVSQLKCNQYIGQAWSILAMDGINPPTQGMVDDQGFCDLTPDNQDPADNVFVGTIMGVDIASMIADPFTYFHRDVPELTPNIVNVLGANAVNALCGAALPEVDCDTWTEIPDGMIGESGDEKRVNELLAKKMGYYLRETGDTAAALTLLFSVNTDYAKRLKIARAMDEKNYAEVQNLKNQLPDTEVEYMYYKELLNLQLTVEEQGRELTDISPEEETLLRQIAASPTQAAMDARVWLYVARGEQIYITLPPLPDFVNNGMTQLQLQFKTDSKGNGLKVYPNPAAEQLNISYRLADENADATFYLFDMTGKALAQYPFTQKVGELNLDLSGYASGMYYYQVTNNGQVIASDKLAIIKNR
ncbi:MAG: T9SS type A sorting domain-containing protein [Sphingobacteriales bacterium]|nr:T9SS type A sorting domain-containing protein [Sphingobacteriales bacterium]MCC7223359.1 T9SS type A sorting domain-containing protein [Chitinophagales bacterium]